MTDFTFHCSTPRCEGPSAGTVAGRWFPQCPTHALGYLEPRLAALKEQTKAMRELEGQLFFTSDAES